ncbi:acyl CoA:acetate/3-ketoacid CoA transferase subunit beta [Anaerobacillus arseniciselenatis]|uniref:Acyl CoA:acetate/3-ketoacid CoA transferase subunit beta n=1 Tax=Anaerobacillus arseniciselenatis TaxID=85682 RepID=A0A1S2LNH6_9BACI|nr:3-oxoacid CoA-transferase subunit B [Anaerobacillus arseniciselenatis]OIJ12975.1 acyl CoA:acetate/3-ketoacid CoA transferase subunit beta [Anaerobacillus arseniciselenatis]
MGMGINVRERIAKRAAAEITDRMTVNLGIGIPTLVANYVPDSMKVMFHAENGILGTGPSPENGDEDANLCNAGGFPITVIPGASYFDSATAFGIIRRGLVDVTILGALEVSERGDLANWIIPGKKVPGVGGAIELAQKSKKVIVLMNHISKNGSPKILKTCNLPLTAPQCVDLIITDMAVFEVGARGLVLLEVMVPYTKEDVDKYTGAEFAVSENLKTI